MEKAIYRERLRKMTREDAETLFQPLPKAHRMTAAYRAGRYKARRLTPPDEKIAAQTQEGADYFQGFLHGLREVDALLQKLLAEKKETTSVDHEVVPERTETGVPVSATGPRG